MNLRNITYYLDINSGINSPKMIILGYRKNVMHGDVQTNTTIEQIIPSTSILVMIFNLIFFDIMTGFKLKPKFLCYSTNIFCLVIFKERYP